MSQYEFIDDLYGYNTWANHKILSLCEGLSDTQLDATREVGMGTLRGTLFHLLTAEQIWMERWTQMPWREFPSDPDGITLDEIQTGLRDVAAQRRSVIEIHRQTRWKEEITYLDSAKTEFTHDLFGLLLHVVIHGIHHRAQALYYLKQFDRTIPGGLDYIFYRLAVSELPQTNLATDSLRKFGMDVATGSTPDPLFDPVLMDRLGDYHKWATDEIFSMCDTVSVASLDKDYAMGQGTIRKSLTHMLAAEQWWQGNYQGKSIAFPKFDEDISLDEIRQQWKETGKQRGQFVAALDQDSASEIITVEAGGFPTSYHVGETTLQPLLHAVHHRAQVINMLRRSEGRIHNIDLMYSPVI